jgi:hypothetical protein
VVRSAYAIPSAFTVQGDATVASYDASAGIMQTYEGEAFAFDKTASADGANPGDEFVSNIHYRCDQFWNCTLRAGGAVLKAKRTR